MAENNNQETTPRDKRVALIKKIERARRSRVICYVTSDRQGALAQIGSDAIRPFYEHLRKIGFTGTNRIDLFIYSRGGAVETPWPLVNMIREYCQELAVLVPFRAHSAATMITLAADEIVMGKKGELGPIDPQVKRAKEASEEQWSTEDILSYVRFMKEKAGLSDQAALSDVMRALADKVGPPNLGSIYRVHSHIRLAARKLISVRKKQLDEKKVDDIIETLCEKIYFHGHAIARKEAKEIGLPIIEPEKRLDDFMWELYLEYEKLMKIDSPIHPETTIPEDQEEASQNTVMASIESRNLLHVFRGQLKFKKDRALPPNLQLNLSFPIQIPGATPQQLQQQLQPILNQLVQGLRDQVQQQVVEQIRRQAPIKGIRGSLLDASWKEATDEGI